jgi:DNA-binding response OmpR family regulator
MTDAPHALTPAEEAKRPQRGSQRRILLVEDNEDAASMLRVLLELEGHNVMHEHSGQAGLERARSERPDVCLLDIGLPDTDGIEVARRLRKIPETAGTVIVGVSGYGQDADRDAAMDSGFDQYFVKPVDVRALLSFIADLPSRGTASADESANTSRGHH